MNQQHSVCIYMPMGYDVRCAKDEKEYSSVMGLMEI